TLTIREKQYKIRLFRGLGPNITSIAGATSNDIAGTHYSEWNRLMYNVSSTNPPSQEGDNWASYSDADLNIGNSSTGGYSWCQEQWSSNVMLNRGGAVYGVGQSNGPLITQNDNFR